MRSDKPANVIKSDIDRLVWTCSPGIYSLIMIRGCVKGFLEIQREFLPHRPGGDRIGLRCR